MPGGQHDERAPVKGELDDVWWPWVPDDSSRQVSWYTILMQVHCTCTWYRYLVLQIVCLFRVPEDSSDWDVYSSRSKRHPCALCSVYRLFSLFDVKFRRNVDDGCGENRHNLVARKPPRHPACTYFDLLAIKFSVPLNKTFFHDWQGILAYFSSTIDYFCVIFGAGNILPCPGTTQSARSSTLLLLSTCLRFGHQCENVIAQIYFSSSSEPADFHRSGSCRSSSFSKLSPAITTVPCSLVPVTTTTLTLSNVWPGVAITLTYPSASKCRPSGSSSLLKALYSWEITHLPVDILVVDCMSHNVHLRWNLYFSFSS